MTWTPPRRSTKQPRVRTAAGIATLLAVSVLVPASTADAESNGRSRPNLSVSALGSPPATAAAGSSFAVEGKVRNRGRRDLKAGSKVTVEVRNGFTSVQVGSAVLTWVKDGRKKGFSLIVQLPTGARPLRAR